MKPKRSPSPDRKKLSDKFRKTTAKASRIRYATMRKVDFSGWADLGRFAKYAQDHLEVARSVQEQLFYWKSLFQIATEGKPTEMGSLDLSEKQRKELQSLAKEVAELSAQERYSLRKSIEYRYKETLDLLQKMAKEGILSPEEIAKKSSLHVRKEARTAPLKVWAVAHDQNHRPIIEGGQLKLYQAKVSPAGEQFRRSLDEAAKFKTEHGTPGKLGFFLGYTQRLIVNHLFNRPYRNSLTEREAKSIQATNEMINFLQKESNFNQPTPMKKAPEKSLPETQKNQVQATPSSNTEAPAQPMEQRVNLNPSIINHITIQGPMHGDIGFQKNHPSPPELTERVPFPRQYPQPSGTQTSPPALSRQTSPQI